MRTHYIANLSTLKKLSKNAKHPDFTILKMALLKKNGIQIIANNKFNKIYQKRNKSKYNYTYFKKEYKLSDFCEEVLIYDIKQLFKNCYSRKILTRLISPRGWKNGMLYLTNVHDQQCESVAFSFDCLIEK